MPFSFPVAPASAALSADGIEIPKGSPSRILTASRKLRATAGQLDDASMSCADAGVAAVEAEGWTGPAALMFAATAYVLSSVMRDGESSLRRAAAACRKFADELERQQDVARAARRAGQAAERRAHAAVTKLQGAATDSAIAQGQADTAATDASVARGAADSAGAAQADHRERTARAAAGRAKAAENRARTALTEANGDISKAIERAEEANELADAAAQRARAILEQVASEAKTACIELGPIPVPVTPTPDGPNSLTSGHPFGLPRRPLTPGDIRRRELEAAAERERRAREAKDDGGGGLLGIVKDLSGYNDVKQMVEDIADGDLLNAAGHLAMVLPVGRLAKGGKIIEEGLSHGDEVASGAKGLKGGKPGPHKRSVDEEPRLDRTGKVHGDLKDLPVDFPRGWTRSDLDEFAADLRASIKQRVLKTRHLGEDGPHRRRIEQERRLLRKIEKFLSGT